MRRIGFIGTENSHTDHFLRFLNVEQRHPGFRATALADGDSERNRALAEAGRIELIVDSPEDLLGQVDAAIISTRDGGRHREQAEPLLRAGVPVLVDKPLAASVADAEAIIAAAEEAGAFLFSGSALRYVPEIAELSTSVPREQLRLVHVIGPADPESEYAGLFFYGIHHVEAALELLGNPVVKPGSLEVTVTRHDDTTVALTRIADVDVVLTFVTPRDGHRTSFHAVATGTEDVRSGPLTLGPDYNAPALQRFVTGVETGQAPLSSDQLLSPVVVLATIVEALAAAS
ncbi:MAG TPA: Gfo/Idh/MocA family oxidoreductase [Actinopolymorphaceae bacterium]